MAIIDAFTFNNELDLLEIRLNILDDYVDKFVIVEADETFSGNSKRLYFNENKERFKKWENKIVHYVVDDFPMNGKIYDKAIDSPNTGNKEHWWVREFYQKESMIYALDFCKGDDIVFISDLDEIWNPEIEIKRDDNVYRPHLIGYYYYLNNRSDYEEGWTGTRYGKYKTLKKYGINHFRTEREVKGIKIKPSGWHFCNLGTAEELKSKLESYGHQEWNNDTIKGSLETCIKENKDFAGRGFNLWEDEAELPNYLINNKEKWKKLFR